MYKRGILILFVLILVTGASCENSGSSFFNRGGSSETLEEEIFVGEKGVELSFLEGAPPKEVYKDASFDAMIELHNRGALDIIKGDIKWFYPKDIKVSGKSVFAQTDGKFSEIERYQLLKAIYPGRQFFPTGDITRLDVSKQKTLLGKKKPLSLESDYIKELRKNLAKEGFTGLDKSISTKSTKKGGGIVEIPKKQNIFAGDVKIIDTGKTWQSLEYGTKKAQPGFIPLNELMKGSVRVDPIFKYTGAKPEPTQRYFYDMTSTGRSGLTKTQRPGSLFKQPQSIFRPSASARRRLGMAAMIRSRELDRATALGVGRVIGDRSILKRKPISDYERMLEQTPLFKQTPMMGVERAFKQDQILKQTPALKLTQITGQTFRQTTKQSTVPKIVPKPPPFIPPIPQYRREEEKRKKKKKRKRPTFFGTYKPSLYGVYRFRRTGKTIRKEPRMVGLGERQVLRRMAQQRSLFNDPFFRKKKRKRRKKR